jgi:hypothetical protein
MRRSKPPSLHLHADTMIINLDIADGSLFTASAESRLLSHGFADRVSSSILRWAPIFQFQMSTPDHLILNLGQAIDRSRYADWSRLIMAIMIRRWWNWGMSGKPSHLCFQLMRQDPAICVLNSSPHLPRESEWSFGDIPPSRMVTQKMDTTHRTDKIRRFTQNVNANDAIDPGNASPDVPEQRERGVATSVMLVHASKESHRHCLRFQFLLPVHHGRRPASHSQLKNLRI